MFKNIGVKAKRYILVDAIFTTGNVRFTVAIEVSNIQNSLTQLGMWASVTNEELLVALQGYDLVDPSRLILKSPILSDGRLDGNSEWELTEEDLDFSKPTPLLNHLLSLDGLPRHSLPEVAQIF